MAINELAPPRPQGERMTILGIDLGKSGAVAVLDEGGELLKVHDTPSTLEPNGRSATNAPLLASILVRSHARIAYCEFVGARPTDAKVAAFAFGRARGVIEGSAGALGLPIVFLTPPTWKRLADIPPTPRRPPPSERSRLMPQSLPPWLSNTAPRWKRCAMRLRTAVRAPWVRRWR
jgi:hypothetical protein